MLKKLLIKGLEKGASLFGMPIKELRTDIHHICLSEIDSDRYYIKLKIQNGGIVQSLLENAEQTQVKMSSTALRKIEQACQKYIQKDNYRLDLALKNGELETIVINASQYGEKSNGKPIDFGNNEVNSSYQNFTKSFSKLEHSLWNQIPNKKGKDLEILSSHLEQIAESITELENVVAG